MEDLEKRKKRNKIKINIAFNKNNIMEYKIL